MKRGRKLYVQSPKGDWRSFMINPDLASCIRSGDTVVEVGACLGATALSLAHKANKVIAIESDPVNLNFLRLNVKAYGFNNIIIVSKAVWSFKGRLRLYTATTSTGHRLVLSISSYVDKPLTGKYVEVEVDTIDNILNTY
ncbi:MAG: FkbM family methyltransferase [Candidatus Nezhaarchaeales archaeon]